MSDVACPKCGEPWDIDTFHEVAAESPFDSFDRVRDSFRRAGCVALGSKCSTNVAHPAIGELLDLLGDDIDGASALLEDFGLV